MLCSGQAGHMWRIDFMLCIYGLYSRKGEYAGSAPRPAQNKSPQTDTTLSQHCQSKAAETERQGRCRQRFWSSSYHTSSMQTLSFAGALSWQGGVLMPMLMLILCGRLASFLKDAASFSAPPAWSWTGSTSSWATSTARAQTVPSQTGSLIWCVPMIAVMSVSVESNAVRLG